MQSMKKMIQTEWWKLRRCQILLVGIVALTLCKSEAKRS